MTHDDIFALLQSPSLPPPRDGPQRKTEKRFMKFRLSPKHIISSQLPFFTLLATSPSPCVLNFWCGTGLAPFASATYMTISESLWAFCTLGIADDDYRNSVEK